jgi:hypothetical protein
MRKRKTKKNKINENIQEINHSFLFWLVIPFLILWLSISYVIGFIKDKPNWNNTIDSKEKIVVKPQIHEYKNISGNLDQAFISFWFDDAWLSQYMQAYPVLKSYNFPAAIAVPTNTIETTNYMNWAQLKILAENDWEITDHGLSHDCTMANWDKEKIDYEYKMSKLILWKNKLTADIFVTPCGVNSQTMHEEAYKYFIGYRTVDPGFNNLSNFDVYNLKVKNIDNLVKIDDIKGWIQSSIKDRSWLILVFHKVGEATSDLSDEKFNISLNDFKNIVEYIKSSNTQVVVPSQIISSVIK